jgi:hypothetical protein
MLISNNNTKVKQSVNVIVELELHLGVTWPKYTVNQELSCKETQISERIKKHKVVFDAVTSPLILDYTKFEGETVTSKNGEILFDQKLKINKIWIDNILLEQDLVKYSMSQFDPNYNTSYIEYCEQNQLTVDHGPLQILEFFHSGKWRFSFQVPFWNWYNNLMRERVAGKHNKNDLESYFGIEDDDNQQLILKLKELLGNV